MLSAMSVKIVTHSGDFHPDDVCAVATLLLYLKNEVESEIIRTRDPEIIQTGDWVIDVGWVYDPTNRKFDHHQPGAPVRDNGIPYAAFGLIWKELGEAVCASPAVAQALERSMVQPIDAGDTGIILYNKTEYDISPFEFYKIIESFHEPGDGHTTTDEMFWQAVLFVKDLLERLIRVETKREEARHEARNIYHERPPVDGVIVAEHPVSIEAFQQFSDVHVVVKPRSGEADTDWIAKVVPSDGTRFENRALFPEDWAGLQNGMLAEASHIPDAIFCHQARFIFVAHSREGALAAAREANVT